MEKKTFAENSQNVRDKYTNLYWIYWPFQWPWYIHYSNNRVLYKEEAEMRMNVCALWTERIEQKRWMVYNLAVLMKLWLLCRQCQSMLWRPHIFIFLSPVNLLSLFSNLSTVSFVFGKAIMLVVQMKTVHLQNYSNMHGIYIQQQPTMCECEFMYIHKIAAAYINQIKWTVAVVFKQNIYTIIIPLYSLSTLPIFNCWLW